MDRIITSFGTTGVEVALGISVGNEYVGVEVGVAFGAQLINMTVKIMKVDIKLTGGSSAWFQCGNLK
jgi:hypothetical protein